MVLTNLRGEDHDDVAPALDLMRRKHLVVLTSLREQQVEQLLNRPIHTLEEAGAFGAAARYLDERAETLNTLERRGVITLDETAQQLPIALANRYLQIKRSGQL